MAEPSTLTLPESYKAIFGARDGKTITLEEIPLVKPGKNEVLVKMEYTPINFVDIATAWGFYGNMIGKTRAGLEGSGVIVAIGNDLVVPHEVGEKVHVLALGTWGQYCLAKSHEVYPIIAPGISLEEAANHFINPGTVAYIAECAEKGNHKCAIHNSGSSAIGRMMVRLFKAKGIKLINIVRKDQYVKELLKDGADYVLNSSDPDFEKNLREVIQKENPTVAFDALGGEATALLASNLPKKSSIYVYGNLTGKQISGLSPFDLIGKVISLHGINLDEKKYDTKPEEFDKFIHEVHSQLGDSLRSNIQKVVPLDQFQESIVLSMQKGSEGKILFKPN